ncbi:hypothetical protein [Desulfolucanica intricata]|uniref:hypothetical protein n=1 Tax=Desulfolucanica intricata TaxID=1285191 RepID=UPI0008315026|nr:hypothetical protein [Desulfolucanica intricata]
MNDLWYIGNGYWMIYVENPELIKEFNEIKELNTAAEYFHFNRGGLKARQFVFMGGEDLVPGKCLLHQVCIKAGFDFKTACTLNKRVDGIWPSYKEQYPDNSIQMELIELQYPPGRSRVGEK